MSTALRCTFAKRRIHRCWVQINIFDCALHYGRGASDDFAGFGFAGRDSQADSAERTLALHIFNENDRVREPLTKHVLDLNRLGCVQGRWRSVE